LSYFYGLSEPIIAVELVQPKRGIFQPHIQCLLCLATTVEVVLLGASFSGSNKNYEEMHLLPEPLFAVPTDGAYIVICDHQGHDRRPNLYGNQRWLHLRSLLPGK
jgi:nuclear pore complex protein Nup155